VILTFINLVLPLFSERIVIGLSWTMQEINRKRFLAWDNIRPVKLATTGPNPNIGLATLERSLIKQSRGKSQSTKKKIQDPLLATTTLQPLLGILDGRCLIPPSRLQRGFPLSRRPTGVRDGSLGLATTNLAILSRVALCP
jgi:hypothetical protein